MNVKSDTQLKKLKAAVKDKTTLRMSLKMFTENDLHVNC